MIKTTFRCDNSIHMLVFKPIHLSANREETRRETRQREMLELTRPPTLDSLLWIEKYLGAPSHSKSTRLSMLTRTFPVYLLVCH